MKARAFAFIVLILLSVSLWGQFLVPRTATIDSLTLQKIREACNDDYYPNSPYADPLVRRAFQVSRDRSLDDSLMIDLREDREGCPIELKEISEYAFKGIFADLTVPSPIDSQYIYLQTANTYIQDSLDVQEFINWCCNANISNDTRGHTIHQEINYLALTADLLFHVPDSIITVEQHNTMIAKLDSIVIYCEELFENLPFYESFEPDGKWGLPGNSSTLIKNNIIQQRPRLLSAMGYCVLILMQDDTFMQDPDNSQRMNDDLTIINNDLLSNDYFGQNGILDINTQKSGAWSENVGYQSFTYLGMINFFTAYKRLSDGVVNYFNNEYVRQNINHAIKMLTPELKHLPYDDMWNMNIGSKQLCPVLKKVDS